MLILVEQIYLVLIYLELLYSQQIGGLTAKQRMKKI